MAPSPMFQARPVVVPASTAKDACTFWRNDVLLLKKGAVSSLPNRIQGCESMGESDEGAMVFVKTASGQEEDPAIMEDHTAEER